jgi:hypothetical protein
MLLAAMLAAGATDAAAHPAPFSYIDVRLDGRRSEGTLVVHDCDVAHDLGVEPPEALLEPDAAARHRDALVALVGRRLRLRGDEEVLVLAWGRVRVLPDRQSLELTFQASTTAAAPATVAVDAFIFPYDPVHQTFVTVYEDGSLRHQAILDAERRSLTYYAGTRQGRWAVVRTFVASGIEHILIGPDHILFLIGLLLLGGSLWTLGGIVTAFTVGHSITLSAAALDLVAPPAQIIEPAIALSIVFVGVDNLLACGARRASTGTTPRLTGVRTAARRDRRVWAAAAFGLVHGFGFASVLKDFGLPAGALGLSLFSFNAGVEIGQLLVVAAVASALALLRRRRPRAAVHVARAGSLAVVLMGTYWFVERVGRGW